MPGSLLVEDCAAAQANGAPRRMSKPAIGSMKESKDDSDSSPDEAEDSPSESGSSENITLANRVPGRKAKAIDDDSDEEEQPKRKNPKRVAENVGKGQKRARPSEKADTKSKKASKASASKPAAAKASPSKQKQGKEDKATVKWHTLEHGGVLFPPEYVSHGIKMKYDGVPVDLTVEQEEIATMYAAMLETDYVKQQKPTFMKNFWEEFREKLGKKHVIQSLDKCDFRDIYDHLMKEREEKKALSKEEKAALKAEKDEAEAKYKFALVDGQKEPVGNFRVEPPGLFRGRGEHPRMGKLKARVYPKDIVINIGKGVKVPDHPYPGQSWKEVRHDQTVTWLAYWKDPVDQKNYKYVWLGANSKFKTEADLEKYERARKLKDHIEAIRADYRRLWRSPDLQQRQKSTALYFIDVLALRAGHEKDEDEADTVGCCTLKAENVVLLNEDKKQEKGAKYEIKLDFLGKDSIRYENVVEVEETVYKNMKDFKAKNQTGAKKNDEEQLFDAMNATDLNIMMKEYMDGLSVKVFRTYNASVTLDRLLYEKSDSADVVSKKADYDRANKEVAVLCNHQRAVSKGHEKSMDNMTAKIDAATEALNELKQDLERLKKGKDPKNPKNKNAETLKTQIRKKQEAVDKMHVQKESKEELKTVALGTSKINYLDPRITVAWCKRMDVPLEKIFNKSLLGKFSWAMEVEPEFRF